MNKMKAMAILFVLGTLYKPAYPLARILSKRFPPRPVYQSSRVKPSSNTPKGTNMQPSMVSSFWNRAIEKGKQASESLKNAAQQWKSYFITSKSIPNLSAPYVSLYPEAKEKKVMSEKEGLREKISYLIKKIFNKPERRKDVLMQLFIPALIKANRTDAYEGWDVEEENFELEKWVKENIEKEDYDFKETVLRRLFLTGRPDLSDSLPFRSGSYEIRFLRGFAKWLSDFDEKGNILLREIIKPKDIKDRADQW